jgi:phosphopantetheinyl transferase (holo-ACP synthase)
MVVRPLFPGILAPDRMESNGRELLVKSKHLPILLGAALLAGCSYTDMDCQSPRTIEAAEQGFAAYLSGLVRDAENLKQQAPGIQQLGGDKELARLIEHFQAPPLKLQGVAEKGQGGWTARTCSGQLVATLQGVEKTYTVDYDIARSRPLGAPTIEFHAADTLAAAYRLAEDALQAARRAQTLAHYQQLGEKARAAGFADVRQYERQQAMQQQKQLLTTERDRINRDMARLTAQIEDSEVDASMLGERLARAEAAHKAFMTQLKSGRNFALGTEGLQLQDIKLSFSDKGEPRLAMKASNKGKQALTSASIEVRVYLAGSEQPFLASGERPQGGRFSLRFMAPGLQPGKALDVQAVMTGEAKLWHESELRAAKRRQAVVRVLDTLAVDAEKIETSPIPDPGAELAAAQQAQKALQQTASALAEKLKMTQAASARLGGEIVRLEADLSALEKNARPKG